MSSSQPYQEINGGEVNATGPKKTPDDTMAILL
jgi:hypothetical protein